MRATLVVFYAPAFQDDACFGQGAKKFPVQALVAQFIMEALNVAILQAISLCRVCLPSMKKARADTSVFLICAST